MPGILSDITRGFGTKFLQHIHRCKIMAFIIDVSLPFPNEPHKQYNDILDIVKFYDEEFVEKKPIIVIATKVDKISKETLNTLLKKFKELYPKIPVIPVSAEKRINIKKLLKVLRAIYENLPINQNESETF